MRRPPSVEAYWSAEGLPGGAGFGVVQTSILNSPDCKIEQCFKAGLPHACWLQGAASPGSTVRAGRLCQLNGERGSTVCARTHPTRPHRWTLNVQCISDTFELMGNGLQLTHVSPPSTMHTAPGRFESLPHTFCLRQSISCQSSTRSLPLACAGCDK